MPHAIGPPVKCETGVEGYVTHSKTHIYHPHTHTRTHTRINKHAQITTDISIANKIVRICKQKYLSYSLSYAYKYTANIFVLFCNFLATFVILESLNISRLIFFTKISKTCKGLEKNNQF